ncbi:MAG: hypothetical protein GY788_27760 [bacterium]|nr:hypothetical protein [bacterium]
MPKRRHPFAMVPKAVIESDLDASCVTLYAVLDLIEGQDGDPARGYAWVADKLGWQARRVTEHAGHLVASGLIELGTRSGHGPSSGMRSVQMNVVHNPSRDRLNPASELQPPEGRHHKQSVYARQSSRDEVTGPAEFAGSAGEDRAMEEGACPAESAVRPRSHRSEERSAPRTADSAEQVSARMRLVHGAPNCSECNLAISPPRGGRAEDFLAFCGCAF